MNKFLTDLTLVILIGFFFYACVPSKPVREVKEIPASRVIKKVEANRRKISTFRATGILNVQSPKISAKANFEVLLKKPDSVKVSVYGPFGIELAQAVITPSAFRFYDPMNKTLYRGNNKEGIIEKILKVDLSFDDLMDALSGSVNLTENLRNNPDYFNITDEYYQLTYVNSRNKQQSVYDIDTESLALLTYKILSSSDEVILKGKYSNFRLFNEVPVPYNSTIEYRAKEQSLDIEYRNIEINGDISDLSIDLPTDIQVVEW